MAVNISPRPSAYVLDEFDFNGIVFAEKFFGGSVDGMAFTSASSVRSFFEILESKGFSKDKILEGLYGMSVFVIGAQADEECKKMHVKETCVSNVHTIEGLASMITGKI